MKHQTTLFENPKSKNLNTIIVAANGIARNNSDKTNRRAALGYVVDDGDDRVTQSGQYIGRGEKFTSNYADYVGVIDGIRAVKQHLSIDKIDLEIRTNNEIIVKQISNSADAKKMDEQFKLCMEELRQFDSWSARHVTKEQGNRIDQADALAEEAFSNQ